MLAENPKRSDYFAGLISEDLDPYAPFLRILSRPLEDGYTNLKACEVLSVLLSSQKIKETNESVGDYVRYLCTHIQTSKGGELVTVIRSLKAVLKSSVAQHAFVKEGGLKGLITATKKDSQNSQLLYYVLFCLWLISFDEKLFPALDENDIVNALISVLKSVSREKVIRVTFAILKNLLNRAHFNEEMIVSGIMKLLPK